MGRKLFIEEIMKKLLLLFATLHLAAGENISWVSKMLGHSNSQITWTRYNRFLPNLTRDDGSAFERVMNDANKATERHGRLSD